MIKVLPVAHMQCSSEYNIRRFQEKKAKIDWEDATPRTMILQNADVKRAIHISIKGKLKHYGIRLVMIFQ